VENHSQTHLSKIINACVLHYHQSSLILFVLYLLCISFHINVDIKRNIVGTRYSKAVKWFKERITISSSEDTEITDAENVDLS
jgi:hypothetical protein